MSENKVFPKKRALLWSGLCLSICKKSEISWPNLLPYVLLYLFSRANIGGFPAKKQMAANPLLEGIGNCHTPKYIAFDEKWGFEVVPLLANTPDLGSFQFIALEEKWSVEVLFCPLLPSSLDRSQVLKLFHGYSNVLACKTGCSILWLTCVVGIWTVKYVEAALHGKDVGSVRLCYFLSPLGKPLYPPHLLSKDLITCGFPFLLRIYGQVYKSITYLRKLDGPWIKKMRQPPSVF